jgi:nuclear pore complex protein Nup160
VEVFAALIDLLREYEMMNWLCSNVHASPHGFRPQGAAEASVVKGTKGFKENYVCTILEDLFAVHIKPRPTVDVPQMSVTTQQIRDVISWITRQGEVSLPNILVFIQCNLLASNNIDLASDFLRFQPNTAWSTYVKGRLYVAKSDFDTAAIFFQKAAYVLCKLKTVASLCIDTALMFFLLFRFQLTAKPSETCTKCPQIFSTLFP